MRDFLSMLLFPKLKSIAERRVEKESLRGVWGDREGFPPPLRGDQERHVCPISSKKLSLLPALALGMQQDLKGISHMEHQAGWILRTRISSPATSFIPMCVFNVNKQQTWGDQADWEDRGLSISKWQRSVSEPRILAWSQGKGRLKMSQTSCLLRGIGTQSHYSNNL